MEMEELYNMDETLVERPKITQMVIDTFTKILDDQDLKGIKKYGRTIDDADDSQYNWLLMSLEELADFTKYQVKEIKRLENSVKTHEEVGQGYHQEIVELKRELTRAESTAGEYQQAYKNACAEVEEWKHQAMLIVDVRKEVKRENTRANMNYNAMLEVEKERDQFKKRYLEAHAEIQDLQYKLKVAKKERDEFKRAWSCSSEAKTHDCSKNQAIHWQGKDIVKVKCQICDKTLYQA
jgi:chromosome segregation ATPase